MGKPRRERRRQKSLQRKAIKRKEKIQVVRQTMPRSPYALLRKAGSWPMYECLATKAWQKPGEIIQILVARRSPTGQVACGVFLVDLGCLGVKNGFASLFDSEGEYRETLRRRIVESQPMQAVEPNLAAKIVREAIVYAQGLGLSPHRDSRDAMLVLGDADPDTCDTPVPLGNGAGKPFFVAGPYDNVPLIMARLERAVGRDGFEYLVPLTRYESGSIDEGEEDRL